MTSAGAPSAVAVTPAGLGSANAQPETAERSAGFVPWDAEAGLPELLVRYEPNQLTTGAPGPEIEQRAPVAVRALADGTPLLFSPDVMSARFFDSVRVIRLSDPVVRADIETSGQILDVLLDATGEAVVLERVGPSGEDFRVRKLLPAGRTAWTLSHLDARHDARLLTDTRGRIFLGCDTGPKFRPATDPYLIRVDDGSGAEVARWDGAGEPAIYADGRIGFVRYDVRRDVRDWVILDPGTGAEKVIKGTDDTWGVLGGVIGIDAEDRVYGFGDDLLARLAPDGSLDWEVDLTDLAGGWWAPRVGAVTPDGEVLVGIETDGGVQVIGLRPDEAVAT